VKVRFRVLKGDVEEDEYEQGWNVFILVVSILCALGIASLLFSSPPS